jgi:hypothetical protein
MLKAMATPSLPRSKRNVSPFLRRCLRKARRRLHPPHRTTSYLHLMSTDRTRSRPRRGSSNMLTFRHRKSRCQSIALNHSSSLAPSMRNRSTRRLGSDNLLRHSLRLPIRREIEERTRLLLSCPRSCRISSSRRCTPRNRLRPPQQNFRSSTTSTCQCMHPVERRLAPHLTLLLVIFGNWAVMRRKACQALRCPIVMI